MIGSFAAAPSTDGDLLERFLRQHDERAFETLLQRHGPMLFAVCRRVLGQIQDAEDAFQATCLVLARKAGSIGKRASLPSWLYGVAYRTALKAKAQAWQRRCHEERVAAQVEERSASGPETTELRAVLDEELSRLPSKYRSALVLVHLENQSIEEAAKNLGWTNGQLRGALFRGRRRLQAVLERRGLAPALAFTSVVCAEAAPAACLEQLTRAAGAFAAGRSIHGLVSEHVLHLAKGVIRDMFLARIKIAAVVGLMVVVLGAGASAWLPLNRVQGTSVADTEPPAQPASQVAEKEPVDKADERDDLVSVPSQREGVILRVFVKPGAKVAKDDLLAKLDDRLAAADVAIKMANMIARQAEWEVARKAQEQAAKQVEVTKRFIASGAEKKEKLDLDQLAADRLAAEAVSKQQAVAVANQELIQAHIVQELYEIRSPAAGTVFSVFKKEGEAVKYLQTVFVIKPQ
jgi:RNA polymerase sigma-70 factor (ECF subfamily)